MLQVKQVCSWSVGSGFSVNLLQVKAAQQTKCPKGWTEGWQDIWIYSATVFKYLWDTFKYYRENFFSIEISRINSVMHARISGLGTIPVCHMTMTNLLWVWSGSMRAPTLVSILCIILRYGLGSNRAGFLDLSYRHAGYVGQSRYTSTYR